MISEDIYGMTPWSGGSLPEREFEQCLPEVHIFEDSNVMRSDKQKAFLKKLIEDERDPAVLDLVGDLLERRTQGVAFTSDLVARVIRSEEDLKAGRMQSLEEFSDDADDFIDGLYDKQPPKDK